MSATEPLRRRAKGTGSIRNRGTDRAPRWQALYSVNIDGKRRQRTRTFDRKADAQDWLGSRLAQLDGHVVVDKRHCWRIDPRGCHVYVLWDSAGRVLYVGKTSGLFALGSHLSTPHQRQAIASAECFRCDDDSEMAVLEAQLIARHQPPWNTDGKRAQRRQPPTMGPPLGDLACSGGPGGPTRHASTAQEAQ